MRRHVIVLGFLSVVSLGTTVASAGQPISDIVPVRVGMYAPVEGGCDSPAAALIYVEKDGLSANKSTGKVKKNSHVGSDYTLDIRWIEAGSSEADGEPDTVIISVKGDDSFYFSNGFTEQTLMRWCE